MVADGRYRSGLLTILRSGNCRYHIVDLKNLREEFEKLKAERDNYKAGVDGARAFLFGADY